MRGGIERKRLLKKGAWRSGGRGSEEFCGRERDKSSSPHIRAGENEMTREEVVKGR